MSRIRRLGLAAIVTAAMLACGAPAFATEPLTTNGHVTDPDGFLSDEQRATIESPAQAFYTTYNTIIDVVVVPDFSGQKPSEWCEATLKQSRTGEKGILYVVSYEDGTDAFCTDAKMARPACAGQRRGSPRRSREPPRCGTPAGGGARTPDDSG